MKPLTAGWLEPILVRQRCGCTFAHHKTSSGRLVFQSCPHEARWAWKDPGKRNGKGPFRRYLCLRHARAAAKRRGLVFRRVS